MSADLVPFPTLLRINDTASRLPAGDTCTVTILPVGWFGPPQTTHHQKRKARPVEAPCDTEG